MPSLSACAWAGVTLGSCGTDIDRVTSFLVGMGESDRKRDGVMVPELCAQGAALCAMNLQAGVSCEAESGEFNL